MVERLQELQYGRPLKWHQKRRFQRWLWVLLFISLSPFVIASAWWVWVQTYDALLIRQNRRVLVACENYHAPEGQVVFEMKGGVVTRLVPAQPWVEYWSPARSNPTVFLHRLEDQAPTHFEPASQLVVLEIDPRLTGTYDGRTVLDRPVLCFEASQVSAVSKERSTSRVFGSTKLVILPEPSDHIRVFAGQPSSQEDGVFSFDVEYNGLRQTVRGKLRGGLVLLNSADGQMLRPPEWANAVFWIPRGAGRAQESQSRTTAASSGQPAPTAWPVPAWWTMPSP